MREPYVVRLRGTECVIREEVEADSWAIVSGMVLFAKDHRIVQGFGVAQVIDLKVPAPDPDHPELDETNQLSEDDDAPARAEKSELEHIRGQYL